LESNRELVHESWLLFPDDLFMNLQGLGKNMQQTEGGETLGHSIKPPGETLEKKRRRKKWQKID